MFPAGCYCPRSSLRHATTCQVGPGRKGFQLKDKHFSTRPCKILSD
jgi:hypothetical protein